MIDKYLCDSKFLHFGLYFLQTKGSCTFIYICYLLLLTGERAEI